MADDSGGGGNSFLAFIVGGLLVVVLVIGAFAFTGRGFMSAPTKSVSVDIHAPKLPTPSAPSAPSS